MREIDEQDLIDDAIQILVEEKGWTFGPYEHSPVHVDENEEDPVVPSWPAGQVEDYRRAQEQRRELLKELAQRPEILEELRAKRTLEARIRELCEARGLRFAPYECPPWWPDLDLCEDPPPGSDLMYGWQQSVPLAKRLRRKLIAELGGDG